MVCLANSRKIGGRCVAGIRTDGGGWLRPIGDRKDGTLFPSEADLDDGTEAGVLDVVVVDVAEPRPSSYQPENWLLGPTQWRLMDRPARGKVLERLREHLVHGTALLGNTSDRIAASTFDSSPNESSLALIRPEEVRWIHTTNWRGRPSARVRFKLSGADYDLSLTDPIWEDKVKAKPEGTYSSSDLGISSEQDLMLTVSLGEPLNGICYKFVAGVVLL